MAVNFWDTVILFFVAAIVSYLINPLPKYISKKTKIPRTVSTLLVVILLLILFIIVMFITIPAAANQIASLVQDISGEAGDFDELVSGITERLERMNIPESIIAYAAELLSQIDVFLTSIFTQVLTWLVNISLGIFDFIMLVILAIYFMLDGEKLKDTLIDGLPGRYGIIIRNICKTSDQLTKKYIKSRIMISLGMGIVTYIGFTIMGIKHALLFAVMSFIFDFVPYFGSLAAGAIESIYALIVGGVPFAVGVLIFVLIVQQLEGNVVAPRVQGAATGIHPIVIIFSLLCCNELFGPAGMLISTPLAAIIKTVFKEVYTFIISDDGEV